MTDWIDLEEQAFRQFIDAAATFEACEAAWRQVEALSGGMLWRVAKGHEYLIQTGKDNRQRSLGRRSAETERQYKQFTARKRAAQERLRALRQQMAIHHRLNRALRVGRVPALLVRILAVLERRGLRDEVLVAGEAALFAYETAAGVRLCEPDHCAQTPLALQLLVAGSGAKDAAFAALRAADKSFIARQTGRDGQVRLHAANARGWTVDISEHAASAALLAPAGPLATHRFSVPVVAETGRMARLTTIPPTLYTVSALREAARADLDLSARKCCEARARQVGRLVEARLPAWSEGLGSRAREG
jgi:hypothetical protein